MSPSPALHGQRPWRADSKDEERGEDIETILKPSSSNHQQIVKALLNQADNRLNGSKSIQVILLDGKSKKIWVENVWLKSV